VYYRGEPDLTALRALAAEVTGGPVEVAGPGGWGAWVHGGAWLTVDGEQVDWILRDVDRVRSVWADCREGRYEVGHQPGHPLGFWSPVYAGEVALGRVLADPAGELTDLREQTRHYPEPLHAHHRTWCLNEKGALASAAALPDTPPDFRARAEAVLSGLGDPAKAVGDAAALVADVRARLRLPLRR
jgi:hypothetical protein